MSGSATLTTVMSKQEHEGAGAHRGQRPPLAVHQTSLPAIDCAHGCPFRSRVRPVVPCSCRCRTPVTSVADRRAQLPRPCGNQGATSPGRRACPAVTSSRRWCPGPGLGPRWPAARRSAAARSAHSSSTTSRCPACTVAWRLSGGVWRSKNQPPRSANASPGRRCRDRPSSDPRRRTRWRPGRPRRASPGVAVMAACSVVDAWWAASASSR